MALKPMVRDSFPGEPGYTCYENLWKSSPSTSTGRRYIAYRAYTVHHMYFALFLVPFYL